MKGIRLSIDSDLGNVSLVAVIVNAISADLGMEEEQRAEVELCIVEAITNVIRHAYNSEYGKIITIGIDPAEDSVQFTISDSGSAMAATRIDELLHGTPLSPGHQTAEIDKASLPEGGRGLHIMHALMDQIAYTSNRDGNHLTLTKRLPIQST